MNKNKGIKIPACVLKFLAAADILKICKHNFYEKVNNIPATIT